MSSYIKRIDQAIDMVVNRLESQKGPLGLATIGSYDEKRIREYPAVVVVPGPLEKELHAQHTFNILMSVELFVYHADLTLTKRERSKADLELVGRIETELEQDYNWFIDPNDTTTARVVFGYISLISPGALQPRTDKSNVVISTRMTLRLLSQRRFDGS